MRRVRILYLLFWVCVSSVAQDNIRMKLDSLLQDPMFETSKVGLMVYDLTADSVLYELDAQQLLRPASTMKLLTAITALDRLGGEYKIETTLYYTGQIVDGKLIGDIHCVGGFDPMLTNYDVEYFAQRLHSLGINSIEGRIVADCSMKESQHWGEGWCWDDDNPHLWPLSIGRENTFVDQLMHELERDGVVLVDVRVAEDRLPSNARRICSRFHTLGQVLVPMMKKSDNFFAEAVFYQIAAATGSRPAKASDAARVMRQLFRKLGLGHREYRVADGSGLSLYNYVSAELETRMLRYIWLHGDIYEYLYASLPIAGVDGTLSKRMKNTAAYENVRAKTGTVTGVSALAGYCTAANGHQLCFSIINQGIMDSTTGRNFQDRVCDVLCK